MNQRFGIAIYPLEGSDAAALFNLADERMYRAKRQMSGTVIAQEP